jgi:hypothetical protein
MFGYFITLWTRVYDVYLNEIITLSFQIPAMQKTNSRRKTPLEMYFIYLGKRNLLYF